MLWMLSPFFLCFVSCDNQDDEDFDLFGFSYHDNYVEVNTCYGVNEGNLKLGSNLWQINGGTFTMTNFDVTEGQDPDHNLKTGNIYNLDKDKQFLFVSGRKASKEVATTFNDACPPDRNTFNHTAGELNFWMKGTMKLIFTNGETYTFPNTYFAQGHSGAINNWWFGNDAMTNFKVPILLYDPYSDKASIPIPIYFGDQCFGHISPIENPNLVFRFIRGDGAIWNPKNTVFLIGVYSKKPS